MNLEVTKAEISTPMDFASSPLQRAFISLAKLKEQHASLSRSFLVHSPADVASSVQASSSHLPATREEEELIAGRPSTLSPQIKKSRHASIATTESDHEWFDALEAIGDGAQEFVMDPQTFTDGYSLPSKIMGNDSRSSLDRFEEPNDDSDSDVGELTELSPTQPSASPIHQIDLPVHILRRTELPARPSGDEGSLFAILKKNVGKASIWQIV